MTRKLVSFADWEVVRELKERDSRTDVDNFCKRARVSNDRSFKIVRTRDEVDIQWARPDVSAGLPTPTLMKLQYKEFRIIPCTTGNHNLHSDMKNREPGAFHKKCMKSDMHVWNRTFFKPCHSWSMEGWIHSKRRNRLGQDIVERLVRTYTNLQLEHRLELYEAGMLPWDIEMTVKAFVRDDGDGVPHDVSDSESESENDCLNLCVM